MLCAVGVVSDEWAQEIDRSLEAERDLYCGCRTPDHGTRRPYLAGCMLREA